MSRFYGWAACGAFSWLAWILVTSIPCHSEDESAAVERALQKSYEPIDLSLFRDSIHHWQMKDGRDRNDPRYRPEQVVHIAENLLKFQNEDGGWPTNLDWLAIIDVAEVAKIRKKGLKRSSFDNRNTYPQIDYLAKVYGCTELPRYRDAALRGFEYILREQRPSGGWRGNDVDAITFNDDVMVGIMRLLLKIREGDAHFDWLDTALRRRLEESLSRAIAVTLQCQIEVDKVKTAWCQQHDHATLQPVRARSYELPSITAQESVGVVKFLMDLPAPSEEVVAAVNSAVAWFEVSAIKGLRVKTVPIDPVRFDGFTAKKDRIEVIDERAPPIWARFYEIGTNRPFFCNRDGTKVYRLADVHLERRAGYGWYGHWPAEVIGDAHSSWKQRLR